MRVLVTGSHGCIGAWVVKRLLDRGMDVVVFDRDPIPVRLALLCSESEVKKVQVVTGQIEHGGPLKSMVRAGGVTHIVHMAAVLMPFCQSDPVTGALVNVVGTLNVFEAAKDAGRPVRVVYASSSAVWGPQEMYGERPLNEHDLQMPATHYGVFKQATEASARVYYAESGISSVGLRPWTVYGAGRDTGLTADPSLALKAAVLGEKFKIRISGRMNFQYVEDVAETVLACLFASLEGAYAFNLAGDVIATEDFIAELERLRPQAKGLITAEGAPVPVAPLMDDSALREKIPNLPRTPLPEGIAKTLAIFERLKREGRLR